MSRIVRFSLVFVTLGVSVPRVMADTTPPPAAKPQAGSLYTRWPALFSGAQRCEVEISSPSKDDRFRWSNGSGATLTLHPSHDGKRSLPAALRRDPPRTLLWTHHGRPDMERLLIAPPGGDMGEVVPGPPTPKPSHELKLDASCGDAVARWSCDDRQPVCHLSLLVPVGSPEEERRHRVDRDSTVRRQLAGKGARDILIADALRLIEDVCAHDRCSEVVARAAEQLRAALREPLWTLVPPRPDDHPPGLTAQGAPGDSLFCVPHRCQLSLGKTLRLNQFGKEALSGATWRLLSTGRSDHEYTLEDEAIP